MSKYEKLSLVISVIALLVPIVQLLYKKFFRRQKLKYYPNGKAIVYFNQSGSYVRIDGAFEAVNEAASIKRISLKLTRKNNNEQLNLSWSSFISPLTQRIMNASSQTSECAHAFKIEKDSIACLFIEFADDSNTPWKRFNTITTELKNVASNLLIIYNNYSDALKAFMDNDKYKEVKKKWEKEFFWEIGKYMLEISVSYCNKHIVYKYEIEVNQSIYNGLYGNIDESLVSMLKDVYRIPYSFYSGEVDLHTKENDF